MQTSVHLVVELLGRRVEISLAKNCIPHLSLVNNIYLVIVRYHDSNEYQKNQQDLRNSDLEVC